MFRQLVQNFEKAVSLLQREVTGARERRRLYELSIRPEERSSEGADWFAAEIEVGKRRHKVFTLGEQIAMLLPQSHTASSLLAQYLRLLVQRDDPFEESVVLWATLRPLLEGGVDERALGDRQELSTEDHTPY